jgi:3-hydroxybutyryl-CoA dehydrogenase
MGAGIALCTAQNGFYTMLFDVNETALLKAKSDIENSLAALVTKQKITAAEQKKTLQNLKFINDLQECIADLVIEAIVEKTAAKIALFNQLAEINHGETIFATNTSSLSVTEIAKGVLHPNRVIGLHFFNPATIMKLVEVVVTPLTGKTVADTVMQFAGSIKKTPVLCNDSPGFIVNRVARHYYLESLRLAASENISLENIDALLESSGFKMGPFRLMDLIGNDINYSVSESLYKALGQPERLKPSLLQLEKLKLGKLGKKTGEGFYKYE